MELDSGDVKQLLFILQQLVEKVTVANPDMQQEANGTETAKPSKRKKKIAKKQESVVLEDAEEDDQGFSSKIKSKKISVKQRAKNKFDAMPEARMHKEDTAIDKKLIVSPPTQRNRTYQPVNARCRVCGRTESVNPSLVESTDRYKCNRCAASAG